MINYDELKSMVIRYRRDLHQIPELGFFVYKTSAYVKEVLEPMDCSIEAVAGTGIAAFFNFGKEKTIAFRGDMDALPIEEESGAEYSSKHPGCMHACGHDGHMANLLGFAKVLNDYKRNNTQVRYNALLIFQPAEETIEGAKKILESNIFERYNTKAIFGLHLWPMLEKGEIASRPGPMMARSTEVAINFEGKSAHCGEPEKGRDALLAACRFVDTIYNFKDNFVKERSILKFGKMESGDVRNAISSHTRLDGTLRTFNDNTWDYIVNAMRALGDEIESSTGVVVDIDVNKGHPAVVNDERLYAMMKHCTEDLNYVELRKPVLIAEDFSCFEQVIPGVFFFLGTGTGIPLHNDHFDFDDNILIDGVHLFNKLFMEL
ncbi:MAG: M20 family metallopeptidase [Peptostreptococcaceae bacterium]|nr:M20 family metallopeptidase [Peptostreptococcaceae bacterium]MDY5739675.1 M20 family metallopeptidase [Anaerovoracaceae bacterium]